MSTLALLQRFTAEPDPCAFLLKGHDVGEGGRLARGSRRGGIGMRPIPSIDYRGTGILLVFLSLCRLFSAIVLAGFFLVSFRLFSPLLMRVLLYGATAASRSECP